MKKTDIFEGQVYETKMLSRFSSEKTTLSPIKILAHECGFVIFKRDGQKQAIHTKDFISTYIKACGYKLKNKDFQYRGYLVIWADGVYNIGMSASCCALTVAEAKAKIDEFILPPQRTECKPTFKLSNGDTIKF